jgi:hypothetical protein
MKDTCLKLFVLVATILGLPAWNALAATCSVPSATYPTIQAAVDDANCDTINVAPGLYAENISIGRTLSLLGAQTGQPVASRISGGPAESTIQGANPTGSIPVILINATHVTVDGFTIKNSVTANAAIGIQLKPISTYNNITNNIIDGINSLGVSPAGSATAIFIESNAFTAFILQNLIENISGTQSAHGIVLGDGTGAFLDAMDVEHNTFTAITSTSGGAYGILVVNPVIFGGLFFANNDFSNLEGSTLVHGLSFDAAMGVTGAVSNNFTNLIGPPEDNKAIWFSSNAPDVYRTDASGNNFNLTIASYAIAIDPSVNVGGNFVNAGCCWWGSPDGPGPVGPGHGARVSPNVVYNGWRLSPDRTSPCSGNNVPTTEAQCKNGGWTTATHPDGSTFKNQGDCVQFINNGH